MSAGVAVGALLAEQVSGSARWAGLGGTFQILGAAVIAIPMSRLMAARGRRPGLALGYVLAAVGAVGLIVAGVTGSFALLLVSSVLFGGATASNSQARYAAADLALPKHRARDLSIVVWATTVGSVLGPNLVGPERTGRPPARPAGPDRPLRLLGDRAAPRDRRRERAAAARPVARGTAAADRRGRRLRPGPRLGEPRAAGHGRHPGGPPRAAHPRPGSRGDGQRHGDDAAAHGARRCRARG